MRRCLYMGNQLMSSKQVEIKFMLAKLQEYSETLGGSEAKKSLANSEFDFLQEEFLSKRHLVDKLQDRRDQEGVTVRTANIPSEIRQGIASMRDLCKKLREELIRLQKKKKEEEIILEKRGKIVDNCEMLLRDVQERENIDGPALKKNQMTLTDMKARLLNEIEANAEIIHKDGSDGYLTDRNEEEEEAKRQFEMKDKEMDDVLDDIIVGVKNVKQKVKVINEKQDEIIDKTKINKKKMNKLSNRIEQDNDKLKKIIEQFRPNRCCMGIALFLLLVGLIVSILKILI